MGSPSVFIIHIWGMYKIFYFKTKEINWRPYTICKPASIFALQANTKKRSKTTDKLKKTQK